MRNVMFVVMMCLSLLASSVVTAQNLDRTGGESHGSPQRGLAGDYMLTASINCLSTAAGFGPNGELLGKSGTALNSVSGILSLDRDGTGSLEAETAGITGGDRPAGLVVVSNSTLDCDVTWSVGSDRVFALGASCVGDILSGEAAGLSFVSAPFVVTGVLPLGKDATILLANTTPEVEIFRIPSIGFATEQKCGYTVQMVKIADDSDSDSE